jgi:hypothetical protein
VKVKAKKKRPRPGRPSQSGDIERGIVRRAEMLKMRLEHHSYAEIADKYGIGVKTAWDGVQKELDAVAELSDGRAKKLRALDLARLDRYARALEPRVQLGDHLAIAVCLKIMERRAKLLGLDLTPEPTPVTQVNLNLLNFNDPKMQIILNNPKALELLHMVTEGTNGIDASEDPAGDPVSGVGLEADPGNNGASHLGGALPVVPPHPAPE